MKRVWLIPGILIASACGALFAGVAALEQDIAIDDLPAAVRATAEKEAGDNPLTEAEKVVTGEGTLYEVEWDVDGEETEILISASGEVIRRGEDDDDEEREISKREVPKAVLAAINDALPANAKVDDYHIETEDGHQVYSVTYAADGKEHELALTADGQIIEEEVALERAALPATIVAALEKSYPGAEIGDGELVKLRFYEVEIERDGEEIEVMILADGRIIGEEEDD